MTPWKEVVVATGIDFEVSLGEALAFAQRRGGLKRLLLAAAMDKLLRQLATLEKIAISDDELQTRADDIRTGLGLHSAEHTAGWLRRRDMTIADFETMVERSLVAEKLLSHIPVSDLHQLFQRERHGFDCVRLRKITVASEGVAQELLARLNEEGAEFATLARSFSLDSGSRSRGGDLGFVQRRQLPLDVAAAVFGATPGKVVGPLGGAQGVVLYLVEAFRPAELDAVTERHFRKQLFEARLRQEMNVRRLTFPLLDQI